MRYSQIVGEHDDGYSRTAKAVSDATSRKTDAQRTYQAKLRLANAAEANARSSEASKTRTERLTATQHKKADAAATYQASVRRADDAIRQARHRDL